MEILPLQLFCRVHVLYLVHPEKKGRDTLESFYHHRNATSSEMQRIFGMSGRTKTTIISYWFYHKQWRKKSKIIWSGIWLGHLHQLSYERVHFVLPSPLICLYLKTGIYTGSAYFLYNQILSFIMLFRKSHFVRAYNMKIFLKIVLNASWN